MGRILGERERILERRRLVMGERRRGSSLDEIHSWWNFTFPDSACSRSTIAGDIRESLKQAVEETNLATTEWRMLHIQRIEKVISGKNFQNKLDDGDLWAIDRFDKLMDKLIKLTGAYAPTKITATDVTGERDASLLTDDERASRIKDILARAEERRRLIIAESVDAEFTVTTDESIKVLPPGA